MLHPQQLNDEELAALVAVVGGRWSTPLPTLDSDSPSAESIARGRASLEERGGLIAGAPAPDLAPVVNAMSTPDTVLFHRDDYPSELTGYTGFAVVADGAGGWLFDEITRDGQHVIAPVVPGETESFIVHMLEMAQRPDHAVGRVMRLHAVSSGGREVLTADERGNWWVELAADGTEAARRELDAPLLDCVRRVLDRLGPVAVEAGGASR